MLVGSNNQEIMSGLYIFRVETEDNDYIGRSAVIKQRILPREDNPPAGVRPAGGPLRWFLRRLPRAT